jgi:hypothetical protein
MCLDVTWQKVELELFGLFRRCFFPGLSHVRLRDASERDAIAKVRFHELGELRFQFFR